MSISYHGIVGYGSGRVSLPSVDTWGNNMNILRDPPKSIFTRKIDKVSETSEITQMIQDSGDRACEAINVYARGVNPMVSVSYDNYGNNGGQRSGNLSQQGLNVNGGSGRQAYLPYRIMDKGAFRPPIKDQRDLLPLSRLPRVWTSSFSQPGFADFSKKAMCPSDIGEDYRGVKSTEQMLKGCVRPTATYQIETPVLENYEVKYVIKNPVSVPAFSGIQPNAKFNGEVGQPVKEIQTPLRTELNINNVGDYKKEVDTSNFSTEKYTHEVLYSDVNANMSQNRGTASADQSNFSGEKYIQEVLRSDVNANMSQNRGTTSIDELYGVDTENRTKKIHNVNYDTVQTGYEKYEYIHSDIDLERVLPYHEARTNIGHNIHKKTENQVTERTYVQNRPTPEVFSNVGRDIQSVDNISSRRYNLRPTITAGSMEAVPTMPTLYRENNLEGFDIQKSRMRQNIYEMQQDRNLSLGNIPYSVPEIAV